jgi:hypothetical protein
MLSVAVYCYLSNMVTDFLLQRRHMITFKFDPKGQPFEKLKQYPWLWAVHQQWGMNDRIMGSMLREEILRSSDEKGIRMWMYYEIRDAQLSDQYQAVMEIEVNPQQTQTTAHAILHMLSIFHPYPKIEIPHLVMHQISYGSDPSNPFILFSPPEHMTIMDMVCKVHGVCSFEEYISKNC